MNVFIIAGRDWRAMIPSVKPTSAHHPKELTLGPLLQLADRTPARSEVQGQPEQANHRPGLRRRQVT